MLGHGNYAPSAKGEAVDVHVSVFIDRMLNINDRAYEYEVRCDGLRRRCRGVGNVEARQLCGLTGLLLMVGVEGV